MDDTTLAIATGIVFPSNGFLCVCARTNNLLEKFIINDLIYIVLLIDLNVVYIY